MATKEVLDYLKNPNEECKSQVVNGLIDLIEELKSTDPKKVSMGIQKCKEAATTEEQRTKIEDFQSKSTQRKKVSDSDLSKKINDIAEGKYDLDSPDFESKIKEIEDIIERGKSSENPNFSLAEKNFRRIKGFKEDYKTITAKIKSDISTKGIEGLQALKTIVENLSSEKKKTLIYDKRKYLNSWRPGKYTAFYEALRNIFNKTDAKPKITSIEKFGEFKLNYSPNSKFTNYEAFKVIYEVLENSRKDKKDKSNSTAEKDRMVEEITKIFSGQSKIPKDRGLIEKYLEIQNSTPDDRPTKPYKIEFFRDAFLLTKIVDNEYKFQEKDGDANGLILGGNGDNGSILYKINILRGGRLSDRGTTSRLDVINSEFFNEIDKKQKELQQIINDISTNALVTTKNKAEQQEQYDKMKGFLEAANNNKMGKIKLVKTQQEIFNSIKGNDFLDFLQVDKSIPVPDLNKLQEIKTNNADKVKLITNGIVNLDLMIELREIVDNKYEFKETYGDANGLILGDENETGSILKKLKTLKSNLGPQFISINSDFINKIEDKQKELADILAGINGSKLDLNESKQAQQVKYKKMEGFLEAANKNKMGNIQVVKEQQKIFDNIKGDDEFDFLITNAKNPVPDLTKLQNLRNNTSTVERIDEITQPPAALPKDMLNLMIELREIVDNKYKFEKDDGGSDKLILGDENKNGSILNKLETLKSNLGRQFISINSDFINEIEDKQKELADILTGIKAIVLVTGKSKEEQQAKYDKMKEFLKTAKNNKMSNITVVKQKQQDFDTVSKVLPAAASSAPPSLPTAAASSSSSSTSSSSSGGGGGNGGSKKRPRKKHKKKTKKHKQSKNKSKKHNRKSKRFSKKKKTKTLHKKRRNRSIHKRRFKNNKITRHRHKNKYR